MKNINYIVNQFLFSQQEDWPVEHIKTGKADREEDDEDAVDPGEFIPVPVTRLHRPETELDDRSRYQANNSLLWYNFKKLTVCYLPSRWSLFVSLFFLNSSPAYPLRAPNTKRIQVMIQAE